MNNLKFELRLGAVFLVLFLAFWLYLNPGVVTGKLTAQEIAANMAVAEKLPFPGGEKPALMKRLREWQETDDGKPVYMLNLMRYYPELKQFEGALESNKLSPKDSNQYYEKLAMAMLTKLGGYALYAGTPQGANLMEFEPALDNWSRLLVIRYPSRRDFLKLVTDPAYHPIEPYKMMALQVVLTPTTPEIVLPELSWLVGALLLAIFFAVGWWLSLIHI